MSTPKWPHDHSEKHAAAARKGWERRRGRLHRPTKRNEARVPGEKSLSQQRAKIAELKREDRELHDRAQDYRGYQTLRRQQELTAIIHRSTQIAGEIRRREQKLARDERKARG